MFPEAAFDLKVVALMAHGVEKGLVPGEIHIILDPPDADGLAALPMKIAPESSMIGFGDDKRPGRRDHVAINRQRESHDTLAGTAQSFDCLGLRLAVKIDMVREAGHFGTGVNRHPAGIGRGRVAPLIFDLQSQKERLVRPTLRSGNGFPLRRRPRDNRDIELEVRKRIEIAGCLNIGHHHEIAPRFGKGLDQESRAAATSVANADGDGLAGAQIAAMLGHRQDLAPGTLAIAPAVGD